MTEKPNPNKPKNKLGARAEALRANMARRKDQARARTKPDKND